MSISIILAAGQGSRMRSEKPKVLHKICEKPILDYVVSASQDAGIEKNIVIVGYGGEEVVEAFNHKDLIFERQPIGEDAPYGTGFAVKQGESHIDDDSQVLILCGDTPLIREKTISDLLDFHREGKYEGTVLTALLEEPKGYGRIIRDESDLIEKIVEEKDASEAEKKVKEVNSGVYVFNGRLLKEALDQIDDNNAQGEFYITDVVGILNEKGYNIGAYIIEDSIEISGVNSRVQLAFCEDIMRKRINKKHMEDGVTIIDPDHTYIDKDVRIAKDTIIYPGSYLQGKTIIGEGCIIRSGTRLVDSQISDNVEIESSLIESSEVGSGTFIGPNAHLRPNSKIGKDVKIGNFVEVKNSTIGDGSKAGHLSYIGDADIAKNVNIGCGVVFANYDGKNKHRSSVDDNVFIGSSSTIVSPVNIEKDGFVAAGSTITEDIPAGTMSIARSHQKNKKNWVYENKN